MHWKIASSASLPRPAPDQLSLDRLEEGLDSGVVIALALSFI
ncbi:hypothetical protein SAMN04488118_10425 [Epibacterium ulvae]|uniref:Uncharacterized protein n=1 Tax=Epibacterium ulvae TaxID=1156985 RepID=A0A1G5QEH3_9RHOB|nr:hypothetical protein SAMN04488118_10425 [Epibacterium ulvae]